MVSYHESEFYPFEVRWLKLDMPKVLTKETLLDKVDLSRVDAVGFADLSPCSGHGTGGYSDVAWIEVLRKAGQTRRGKPAASNLKLSWCVRPTTGSPVIKAFILPGGAAQLSCKEVILRRHGAAGEPVIMGGREYRRKCDSRRPACEH